MKDFLKKLNGSGAFWNIMGSGMMSANTVILTMLVGHLCDLAAVGMFGFALTTAQVLYAVGLFGANDLQMTDYGHHYLFRHYFWVKVFSTAAAAVICGILLAALPMGGMTRVYMVLLTVFTLLNSVAELYQALFFQCNRIDLTGKSLFARFFLATAAFAIALPVTGSLVPACIWMVITDLAATLYYALRYAKQFRDSGYGFASGPTLGLMKSALPLCLSVLGSLLIINLPKYLINAFLTDEIQGAYSIVFMPTYAISLLSLFLFRPFLYRYSRLLEDDDDRAFRSLLLKHLAVIAAFAVAAAAAMYFIGVPCLRIAFGQDLGAYRLVLVLFMLAGAVMAANQLLYYIMVTLRRQKGILLNYVTGIAVSTAAGMLTVRGLGIEGALLTFAAGQVSLFTGYLLMLAGRRRAAA